MPKLQHKLNFVDSQSHAIVTTLPIEYWIKSYILGKLFTAALALRSQGLVISSREKEEEKEREEKEREEKEEEKNLQIAIRCLWDLFD